MLLAQIRDELIGRTYQPLPPRRQEIPKDGGKVRVADIMHLLKIMLKASGKKGVPQGGVVTPRTQKVTSVTNPLAPVGRGRLTVRGRAGRRWNRVSNDNCVLSHDDFLHQEPYNTLTFRNIQSLCCFVQPCKKACQGLC